MGGADPALGAGRPLQPALAGLARPRSTSPSMLYFSLVLDARAVALGPVRAQQLALVLWEAAHRAGLAWLRDSWPPRLVAIASGIAATALVVWAITGTVRRLASAASPRSPISPGSARSMYWYRRVRPDLFMLAGGVLSLIVAVVTFLACNMLAGRLRRLPVHRPGGDRHVGRRRDLAQVGRAREQRGMSAAALWDRLSAEGLVEGERPAPGRPASPWYVRAMLGIAGWIGALFLIAFVGAAFAFIMEDPGVARRSSARSCCGGAFCLFRDLRRQRFRRAVRARASAWPGR